MAAIAYATERIKIGPLVTPPARRRIHKLARETVTLDRLSGGRPIFGAGPGSDNSGGFSKFGGEGDAKAGAELVGEGLPPVRCRRGGGVPPRAGSPPGDPRGACGA